MMKIAVGSDHAGVALRHELAQEAEDLGYEAIDIGPAEGEKADYPLVGAEVGRLVASGEADLGILVCGTGVGIALAANKVPGIRAAVCSEPYTAELSRRHNNSNIIAVGARVVGPGLARQIVHTWLLASFEGGRHAARVEMLDHIEGDAK